MVCEDHVCGLFDGGTVVEFFVFTILLMPIEKGDLHVNDVIKPLNWIIIKFYCGLMKESL